MSSGETPAGALQVSKAFKVGSVSLEGVITIQNLFDQEWDATFNSTAFRQMLDDEGNYVWMPIGHPTSYWDPRRYELGFRVEF